MSDMFERTIIDRLNDLKQRVADLTAQESIKIDSSTGLPYFPSLTAGSVLFAGSGGLLSQDNANLFFDDTNNRLGLGITSPIRQLHVRGSGQTTAALTDSGNTGGTLYLQDSNGGGGNGGAILFGANQGYAAAIKSLLVDGNNNTTSDLAFSTRNANNDTALVERMRIMGGGNVGIGSTAPIRQVHVRGAGQTTAALTDSGNTGGTLYLQDSGGGGGNGGAILFGAGQGYAAAIKSQLTNGGSNTTSDLAFSTRNATGDTALTERMRIMAGGSVGIGTPTPTGKLDVTKADNTTTPDIGRFFTNNLTQGVGIGYHNVTAIGSNTNQDISLVSKGTGSANITVPGAGSIALNTSNTLRWTIDSSGNLNPVGTGALNIGSAVTYVGDVSYKTLTDRGCLALIDEWELLDGRKVSNLQVFREMKAHTTEKTIYGEVKLDYASVPRHARKEAPIAEEDTELDIIGPDDEKLKFKKGDKMGEDGVEMTSVFSMMIGAIRELADEIDALKAKDKT